MEHDDLYQKLAPFLLNDVVFGVCGLGVLLRVGDMLASGVHENDAPEGTHVRSFVTVERGSAPSGTTFGVGLVLVTSEDTDKLDLWCDAFSAVNGELLDRAIGESDHTYTERWMDKPHGKGDGE